MIGSVNISDDASKNDELEKSISSVSKAAEEAKTAAETAQKTADSKATANFVSITLPASGWVDNAQTVDVPGVTADEENCHPRPYPATASHEVFYDCDVRGIAQLDDKITFGCKDVPEIDLTVGIEILFGRMTKV